MLRELSTGFFTYSHSMKIMSKYKLWRFVIIPGLISMVIAGGIFVGVWFGSPAVAEWLMARYPFEWGKDFMNDLAPLLTGLLGVILAVFSFKYIVMVVVAPFMSFLSEKVEANLTGKPAPEVNFGEAVKDIIRGLRIALRNLFREMFMVLFLMLLGFMIPVVGNIASAVLIFLIQSYYTGFGNMDYTLERKRYGVKDSVKFVRAHRGLAMGNGAAFTLLLMVPILGWFLAPAWGAVSATLNLLDMEKQQSV
ncbi:EI24 domain-containing protein [Pontibacter sp. G13]|uniref:EI24 domain-containing protein n=1 Tax=Pontibacter sp. G13 TaxID=3074898 RepID=UPI00288BF7E2|nr:EI24 domain-containing protein [Pontibacter sp. G13]WNJ20876.1 EI24 domain-containing protein [Pontibacter sp. G13]